MASIEFDMNELDALPKEAARAKANQWRERAMEELARAGHDLDWNVDPVLESFTEVKWDGENWYFEVRHSAAGFMEFGTSPHPIEPVEAQALHFIAESGEEVFTTHVDHPGQPAVMYIRKSKQKITTTEKDISGAGFDPERVMG